MRWVVVLCPLFPCIFKRLLLVDDAVDLEVIIPTLFKGGDVVEDGMVPSSAIVHKDIVVEDVPSIVPHNVLLFQSCL